MDHRNAAGPRRSRGFRRTSTLLQDRIRKAGESRGFAVSRILTHWADVVGADMAAIARPVDMVYGRRGLGATLTLLVTGANAPRVEMMKERLRERVNACYGYTAVSRIRLTQTAAAGFAEPAETFDHAPRGAPPAVRRQATDAAAPIADDALRAAIEELGTNVLAARHHRKDAP